MTVERTEEGILIGKEAVFSKEPCLIDRFENLEISQFKKEYLNKKRPVIISNSLKWKALAKWNLDYFRKIYPEKLVVLTVLNPALNTLGNNITLKFPDAINLINNNTDKNKKYYLMQRSIHDDFPELASDISTPKYAENNNTHIVNLWLGERGINTKPHYDYYSNFLTQIFGRKRVRLFAPSDTPYMYPYSMEDTMTVEGVQYPTVHASRIADLDSVDTSQFPNIKQATPFEGILNPGDLLYIPAGWWHEVKSLDLTLSINFWDKVKVEDFPKHQLEEQVYSYFYWFPETFHSMIRDAFDFTSFENDLEVAEFCLAKNYKCVSSYFLLNFLNGKLSSNTSSFNENKILEWNRYLEIAKKRDEELLDKKKIIEIIEDIKLEHVI